MKRKSELSPAEAEHVALLMIWAGFTQMVLRRWIAPPPTGLSDKVGWIQAHLTRHERRVMEAEYFSDAVLRQALVSAMRKVTLPHERAGRGRKKRRRSVSED